MMKVCFNDQNHQQQNKKVESNPDFVTTAAQILIYTAQKLSMHKFLKNQAK